MTDSATVHDLDAERQRRAFNDLDAQLAKGDKGVIGCLSNLILIVGQDPELANLCAYDDFAQRLVLRSPPPVAIEGSAIQPGPYPRSWVAADVALIQSYIQRVWCRSATKTDTEDAMLAVATSRRFHPVRDWLASLKWDYKPRIDRWLSDAYGARDDEYHRAVGAAFLIAAVRRVRQPGVKHDHMPVFEGLQGLGKSKSLRVLFGDAWFTDSMHPDLTHKDAAIGLHGKWCVEFSEVEHLIRSEVEVVKAYLARQTDWYKPPYGKTFVEVARQSVFAGTTNADDYLRDSTGNRRFWPIRCTKADPDWIAKNREQLWAEAAYREAQGEPHWLDIPETAKVASQHQAERQQDDSWLERIEPAIRPRSRITVGEIMTEIICIPLERQGRPQEMRIGRILRQLGWESVSKYDPEIKKTARWWERKA